MAKPRVLAEDDLQNGAYLKRRAIEHPPRLYEVEKRDGHNIVLRDSSTPYIKGRCIGSNGVISTQVGRVCQEFELVIPREDVWATRMNQIVRPEAVLYAPEEGS